MHVFFQCFDLIWGLDVRLAVDNVCFVETDCCLCVVLMVDVVVIGAVHIAKLTVMAVLPG